MPMPSVNKPANVGQPATTASFQIETAKIPAPAPKAETEQKAKTEDKKPDYSDLIMPDQKQEEKSEEKSTGGIDIMALLSAQAKKLENISTIEMMEMYGEDFTEITLEDLEKYINKNHK